MRDVSQEFHDMLQSLFEFSLVQLDGFCQTPKLSHVGQG